MKKVSVCLCGRATGGLVGPPPENNPPRFLGARRTPGGGPSPLAAPSREKKKSDPTSPRVCGATIGGDGIFCRETPPRQPLTKPAPFASTPRLLLGWRPCTTPADLGPRRSPSRRPPAWMTLRPPSPTYPHTPRPWQTRPPLTEAARVWCSPRLFFLTWRMAPPNSLTIA